MGQTSQQLDGIWHSITGFYRLTMITYSLVLPNLAQHHQDYKKNLNLQTQLYDLRYQIKNTSKKEQERQTGYHYLRKMNIVKNSKKSCFSTVCRKVSPFKTIKGNFDICFLILQYVPVLIQRTNFKLVCKVSICQI